jgi:predicted metal-dependent hydrolase
LPLGTYPTTVEIPGVGPVAIIKSNRAKYIRITISPDRTIRLIVPRRKSIEKGRQFLHSKVPWIIRNLPSAAKLEKPRENLPDFEVSKHQACEMLVGRLRELARIHHFDYKKVSIKNQKTKWGSCSSKNRINLNINLVRLPDQLRDYVILHELVHTRIKNHSKEFWAELDRTLGGGARELARALRKYRLAHHTYGGQVPSAAEGIGQLV